MATSQSAALKHWARIILRWPVDKVRPEHVHFQKIMQGRIDKHVNPSLNTAATSVRGNEAQVQPTSLKFDEAREMRQVNALYCLLENRFQKAAPLAEQFRHPASDPQYYDKVLQELREAPTRSWFGGVVKRVQGALRLT